MQHQKYTHVFRTSDPLHCSYCCVSFRSSFYSRLLRRLSEAARSSARWTSPSEGDPRRLPTVVLESGARKEKAGVGHAGGRGEGAAYTDINTYQYNLQCKYIPGTSYIYSLGGGGEIARRRISRLLFTLFLFQKEKLSRYTVRSITIVRQVPGT